MKKFLLSILIGSVVLGLGIGISILEISHWEISDYPSYLDTEPVENYNFTAEMDLQQFDSTEFYFRSSYRGEKAEVEIVEDAAMTDSFAVAVEYRGLKPVAYPHIYISDMQTGEEHMAFTVRPGGFESFKLIRQVIEKMFEDKVFYLDASPTLVEKVTVYTAYPEKINVIR